MIRKLLILILFSLQFCSFASHIVGGEIYYDCLGGNQYRITVAVYRDCNSDTGYDDDLPLTVFDGSGNELTTYFIPFPGSQQLSVVFNNPCVTIPSGICVEEAIYQQVATLPASSNGYTLSYQKCCRTGTTLNLTNPDDQGITLTIDIPPNATASCNNSPRFVNYPPLLLCADEQLVFDHAASDPDSDSLVYSLCTPYQGGGSTINLLQPNCATCPSPIPATAPPYTSINWATGYNAANPFGNGTISINPQTGMLLATPQQPGHYAIGVCVSEYRNGVLIGTSIRDFIFQVMDCEVQLESIIVPQADMSTFTSYCQGMTVNFENNSYGGDVYQWDFGVSGIATDVSNAYEPSYTFPGPGTYDVSLIVNPGWPCTDTSVETFIVNEEVIANFTPPAPQCIVGNSFDFQGQGQYPATGVNFLWEFGSLNSPDSAFTEDVNGVIFSEHGYLPVTYTVITDYCEVSFTDSILVYAEPTIDFYISDELKCAPYEAHFIDQSFASTDIYYMWDFGDGTELSSEQNPVHTYGSVGVYDVTLTIWTDQGCIDTLTMSVPDLIEVFPSPTSEFNVSPYSASVFDPHFYFENHAVDAIDYEYVFTDGETSTSPNVWHSYVESGYHYPYLVVHNEYGCPDTSWGEIFVEPLTTIYVPNSFTPDGDSKNEVWKPVVYDTEEYELYIFNRWGQVILHSYDEGAFWDGTINGKKADMGVYVWQIQYTSSETHLPVLIRGHFSLLR